MIGMDSNRVKTRVDRREDQSVDVWNKESFRLVTIMVINIILLVVNSTVTYKRSYEMIIQHDMHTT